MINKNSKKTIPSNFEQRRSSKLIVESSQNNPKTIVDTSEETNIYPKLGISDNKKLEESQFAKI